MQLSASNLASGWISLTSTPDIGAFFRSHGYSKRLIITFDALSEFNHSRQRFSGDILATHCEADHLHVGTALTSWFQSPNIATVVDAVKKLRESYDEAVLYGHSMGAYAALLFSGPFYATNVVAFAPQFSINPAIVPFESRFQSYADGTVFVYDDMNGSISQTAPKHIVFDPYFDQDRKHFDMIAHSQNIIPVRIPFAGHYPGQLMREAGILRQTVVDLLLRSVPISILRQRIRTARRSSHRYFVERAIHVARRGRLREAFKLVNCAYVLDPTNPSVLETYKALLQFDSVNYGLAHAILRLIRVERPEWTFYSESQNALWGELEKSASAVIRKPESKF